MRSDFPLNLIWAIHPFVRFISGLCGLRWRITNPVRQRGGGIVPDTKGVAKDPEGAAYNTIMTPIYAQEVSRLATSIVNGA